MTEKFKFVIHSVEKIDHNDLTDVITSINWSYYYFVESPERNAMRSVSGMFKLELPDSANFVEIANINHDVLLSWMQASDTTLSKKLDIAAMDQRLKFMMDMEIRPTIVNMIQGLDKLNP